MISFKCDTWTCFKTTFALFLLWFKLFLLFNKMGQRDLNKMCFWSFYGLKVIKKCLPRFTKYKKCFIERAVNVHVLYDFKYLQKFILSARTEKGCLMYTWLSVSCSETHLGLRSVSLIYYWIFLFMIYFNTRWRSVTIFDICFFSCTAVVHSGEFSN